MSKDVRRRGKRITRKRGDDPWDLLQALLSLTGDLLLDSFQVAAMAKAAEDDSTATAALAAIIDAKAVKEPESAAILLLTLDRRVLPHLTRLHEQLGKHPDVVAAYKAAGAHLAVPKGSLQ
jgi:hypothetical protein